MSVRIIIDREVKKGKEVDFAKALRKLRAQSIFAKGYISGEILRVRDRPGKVSLNGKNMKTFQKRVRSMPEWRN
jgi:hypothetical protein